MSWFDGSFDFARSALSQAQKSIDKVLDIKEEQEATNEHTQTDPPRTSSSATDCTNDGPKTSPKFSTSTPKLSSSRSTPSARAPSVPSPSSPTQDSFSSTWGGAHSLWSSPTTPSQTSRSAESAGGTQRVPSSAAGQSGKAGSSGKKGRYGGSRQREGSDAHVDSSPSSPSLVPSSQARPSSSLPLLPSSQERPSVRHARASEGGEVTSEVSNTLSPVSERSNTPTCRSSSTQQQEVETAGKCGPTESHTVCSGGSETATAQSSVSVLQPEQSTETSKQSDRDVKKAEDSSSNCTATTLPAKQHSVSPHTPADRDMRDSGEGVLGAAEAKLEVLLPPEDTTDGDTTVKRELVEVPPRPGSPSLSVATDTQLSGSRGDSGGGWTEIPLSEPPEHTGDEAPGHGEEIESNSHDSQEHRPPLPPPSTATPSPILELHLSPSPPLPVSHSPLPSHPSPSSPLPSHPSPSSPLPSHPSPSSPMSLPPQQHNSPTPTTEHSERAAEKTESFSEQEHLITSPPPATQPPGPLAVEETVVGMEGEGEVCVGVSEGVSEPGDHRESSSGTLTAEKGEDEESVPTREEKTKEVQSSAESATLEALQQELERVKGLLEARETRMVEMSREVIQLGETNQELQSRLSAAEHDLHTSEGGVEELRSEFTKRIGTTEKKLQTIIKERDSLKKQLQVLATEQSHQRRSASQELTALLKEKEEQIAGLMEEGEKLSKKELQNSNIIKKLKEKNKQNDQLLTAQRQQIEDCEREMSRLKELLKKKEESEKKYQESLSQLNSIAEQQEKELTALKAEREELSDKARSLQTNLDNAYKELSELHKVTAVSKSAVHEAVISAEQTARQELTEALERQRVEHHREREKLLLEVSELRASVSRCEQQAAWREERMKQEVSDVQQRLQEAEMRNQELTTTISQTTKPFLRQIETLRTAHSAQTANWEKVEADLTHRLVDAQTQLSAAVEKERSATEKALTHQSRVTHLEKQIASLRQDNSRLTASLELERAKAETLEDGQQRESAKMEVMRASMQQSLEELRKEKEMLERQLEYERVRLEAESRKACLELQEKERLRSQLASSLSRGLSRQSSTASTTHTQSEILEKSLVQQLSEDAGGGTVSESGTSLYHGKTPRTTASAIEQLQSLLKQKEGELSNAQALVSSLERSRAAMANDLAAVSSQNVDLTEKVDTIPNLQTKLQELQKRNEALLQMYGEKAEETEELRLDIQDLKEMYRQQIDALTKR